MIDNIYGLSEKALNLCETRAELLTNNIANSATPHYKAKDIDFHKILQGSNQGLGINLTHSQHLTINGQTGSEPILFRTPNQASLDGNTVDDDLERKNFIENALNYQVNLTFIKNKTEELTKAIKGG
jgi:flagellar basal-body rod protein FlgB